MQHLIKPPLKLAVSIDWSKVYHQDLELFDHENKTYPLLTYGQRMLIPEEAEKCLLFLQQQHPDAFAYFVQFRDYTIIFSCWPFFQGSLMDVSITYQKGFPTHDPSTDAHN